MTIEKHSVEFRILAHICATPRPVRGTSTVMLLRRFEAPQAIDELRIAGLIRERGWDKGPGGVWVPTEAGEALYRRLCGDCRD